MDFAFQVQNQKPVANMARFGVQQEARLLPHATIDMVYSCHGYQQSSGGVACAEEGIMNATVVVPAIDAGFVPECDVSDVHVASPTLLADESACGITFQGNESQGGDVDLALKVVGFPARAVR